MNGSESESLPTNALGPWFRQNPYQEFERSKQRPMESHQYLEGLQQQGFREQHMPQQPFRPDFNSGKTDFNVWDSFNAAFLATQDAERRRKTIEGQQVIQRLGQQRYLPGYEGVQGAEMPG